MAVAYTAINGYSHRPMSKKLPATNSSTACTAYHSAVATSIVVTALVRGSVNANPHNAAMLSCCSANHILH